MINIKVGPEKPTGNVEHGYSLKYGGALFSNEKGCQYAQLDSHVGGKSYGWWKFPANTFLKDNCYKLVVIKND